MTEKLTQFIQNSPTAYHACENAAALLLEHGFTRLRETEDWNIAEGGKYFLIRNDSSLIAFTVGALDDFSYKLITSHADSPMLKLKENPVQKSALYATLNVEPYGGGAWQSYLDRPLKLAGRVIKREGNLLKSETVTAPFLLTIPSLAIHQNRNVNEGFAINKQIDLQPLICAANGISSSEEFLEKAVGEGVVSHDLYLVNADMPYSFGLNNEFFAAPRIDNLTSMYSSLEALLDENDERRGICMIACLDCEEVGSTAMQGADGDFLENTMRRIAYALRFDDMEYYKALAASFLLSADNAHAVHPNHSEKADPTNQTQLGGGVVLKSHAGKAYVTDGLSSAVMKALFDNAGIKYQYFFNRSDLKSGSTLGAVALRHVSMLGADVGIAQLAMHSACECFAKADYDELTRGLTAFFKTSFLLSEDGVIIL